MKSFYIRNIISKYLFSIRIKFILKKLILWLCILGLLQNCLMIPRDTILKDILKKEAGSSEKTIFYVSFISNPVLEDNEYIVDSSEKFQVIERAIEECRCIQKYKIIQMTTDDKKGVRSLPDYEKEEGYHNQVFLEFYTNQHSYQSLFNLFYFFDRDKKNKRSIYTLTEKENQPLKNIQDKLNQILQLQKDKTEEHKQEIKITEKIIKEAFKNNNKKSSKKGGGAGLFILAIVTFAFTATVHYAQTDIHLNYSSFRSNKLQEKKHYTYTLDAYSHLFLVFHLFLKSPQNHFEKAYKELSATALSEIKKDNMQISMK